MLDGNYLSKGEIELSTNQAMCKTLEFKPEEF